ncbi:MAG: helix-turn-helix domain-containing protein [Bacteroidales bacterium]
MRAKEIDRLVSKIMCVSVKEIHGKSTDHTISDARHIAMYLRRKYLKFSYPMLGAAFQKKHHSTPRAGVIKVMNLMETDHYFREKVMLLEKMLEERIPKLIQDKKRYNYHQLLRNAGYKVDAKQKIIFISQDAFDTLKGTNKKRVKNLAMSGYSIQLLISM